jgi:serine/threonine-protein kinase HipA
MKYEKEGGPTFEQCFEAVRSASVEPLEDGRQMLRWLAFNVLMMNADAHAKNVALLYRDRGQIRLAPFYDLVCTRAYERLSRDLAMSIGGVLEPTDVRRQHWERLAESLNIGGRFVLDLVGDLSERLADAVTQATSQLRTDCGESPVLQMIVPKVRRQRTRILKQLA